MQNGLRKYASILRKPLAGLLVLMPRSGVLSIVSLMIVLLIIVSSVLLHPFAYALSKGKDEVRFNGIDVSQQGDKTVQFVVSPEDGSGKTIGGLSKGDFNVSVGEKGSIKESEKDITDFILKPEYSEHVSIIVAMDVGKSMQGLPMASSAKTVNLLLNSLSDDYVSLVTFGSEVKSLVNFTRKKDVIREKLNGVKAGDTSTLLYQAIFDGIKKASIAPTAKSAILIITNGKDSGSQVSKNIVMKMVKSYNIPIHIIVTGKHAQLAFLKRIAALSGGSFSYSTTEDTLKNVIRMALSQRKGKYLIEFNLNSPPGKYTGTIRLNYQSKAIVAKKDFDFNTEKTAVASGDNAHPPLREGGQQPLADRSLTPTQDGKGPITSGATEKSLSESASSAPQPLTRALPVESPLPEASHSETPAPAVTPTHTKTHARAIKHAPSKTSAITQAAAIHKGAAPSIASSASSASGVSPIKESPQPVNATPASTSTPAVSAPATSMATSTPAGNIEASEGITGSDSHSLWVLLIISIGINVLSALILLARQKNYKNDFLSMTAKSELQSQSLKSVEDSVDELKERLASMNYDSLKSSLGMVTGKLVAIEELVTETDVGIKSSFDSNAKTLEALTEKTGAILSEASLDTTKEFRAHDEKVAQQFSQLNSRLNEIETLMASLSSSSKPGERLSAISESASTELRAYVDESVVPRFEALVREATESVSQKIDEGVKNRILAEIVSLKEGVIEIIRFLLATSK